MRAVEPGIGAGFVIRGEVWERGMSIVYIEEVRR